MSAGPGAVSRPSAGLAGQDGQRLGVDGFVQEREAGRAEDAVAPGVHLPHQHVVQAWAQKNRGEDGEMAEGPTTDLGPLTFGEAGTSFTGGRQGDGRSRAGSGDVQASRLVDLD